MRQKTLLIITDGIGHSEKKDFNAFYAAKKPTYDYLFANVPYSLVKTYGLSVGLPEGQMGNSEVGHMTIGSGRILYQDLVKISLSLEDGSLAKNEKLCALFDSSNDIHIAVLTSAQLWLFLWGPMHGRGLQVSLGYFLLPLVLVLAGRFLYGEKLSWFQFVAVLLAVFGVGHEIWRLGHIAWETALVAIG